MKDRAKKQGFSHRVNAADKASVAKYLNQELKRHIDIFMEKQQKVKLEYQAEKTKLRRGFRQKQSERAKNHLSEETKTGIDDKREEAMDKLKEQMRLKGADPIQQELIDKIRYAVENHNNEVTAAKRERAEKAAAGDGDDVDAEIVDEVEEAALMEIDADSIPFVSEQNVATHLGKEKGLQEVLELMISKLRNKQKTVDSLKKPQILMLTQDTLKVAALFKALRDRFAIS